MRHCHKCGSAAGAEKVGRRDECEVCGADLHVCLNCAFYDQARANQCFEPQAERVQEKDRSNYCGYFEFKKQDEKKSIKDEADKLWKELFKK
jgi:hypothetical protein